MDATAVAWIFASYVIGSIPFGLLVSMLLYRQDLRKLGSGNIGATNVLRNYGVRPFIAVMLMDMAKGVAAVAIGKALGLGDNLSLVAGLASIIGHNWSIFLGFKGGKGIATSGGVIIAAYLPQVTVAVLGTFVVVVLLTRIMSVASMSAAVAFTVATFIVYWGRMDEYWLFLVIAVLGSALAIYQHRENFKRLLKGEEPKLGKRKAQASEAEE